MEVLASTNRMSAITFLSLYFGKARIHNRSHLCRRLISQVTPLLGITPHENTQLQSRNTPEDIADILGTRAFQKYVDTPPQTLDGIILNQPKRFLPLAKVAKRIAEEMRIEKINKQWGEIP